MRFLRIRVGRFGTLRDIDLGSPAPLPSLVAILGPNEVGKSTIHQLLIAILYGFSPASRDKNPYTPWEGGDIDISADLLLADGEQVTIQRRLAGSPTGHVIHANQDVDAIANRDLPDASHLNRKLFTEVYGITHAQLVSLASSTWASVQDDLVTGLGAQDLRAPRSVAKQFEEAANRLWRSDARGKPSSREIEATLLEEGAARRRASERDRELRSIRGELLVLAENLDRLRAEAELARERRKALRELTPLRRRLNDIDRLEAAVRDPAALAKLPRDPERVWNELRARLDRSQKRLEDLGAERERALEAAGSRTDADRKVLERAEALESIGGHEPLLAEWEDRAGAVQEELARLDAEIAERAPRVLGGSSGYSADLDLADRIRSIRAELVAAGMERLDEARRRAAEARRVEGAASARGTPDENPWPRLVAGLASLLVFALGMSLRRPVVWVAGAILLVAVLVRSGWRRGPKRDGSAPGRTEPSEISEGEVAAAEAEVRSALGPLVVPPTEPIRSGLGERVEAVQALLRDRDARVAELRRLDEARAELREGLGEAARDLDWRTPAELSEALPFVRKRLDEARARDTEVRGADREATRLQGELEREAAERNAAEEALRAFERTVEAAGASPSAEGLAELSARRTNLDHLERARCDLATHEGGIEGARKRLSELESRIGTGENPEDGPDIDAVEAQVDRLEVGIREGEARKSALAEREKGLLEWDTVDAIDGRIERLRSELATAEREHDRLLVLARVLSKAEERFRSERQPGLLRRAQDYLDRITSGRYSRILVGDRGAQGDFLLDAAHLPEPLRIDEPLSLGTREQVYFALRLAIVDHLDQGREPMPLLLDEVLVNWDPERRARTLSVLAEESRRRQVFVFTCHPNIAKEIKAIGGAIVDLSEAPVTGGESRVPRAGSQPELELPLGE